MKNAIRVISESTLIPVSMVVVIVGGIYWLTTIYNQGVANASSLIDLQTARATARAEYLNTIDKMNSTLTSIDQRLSRIEGKLERR